MLLPTSAGAMTSEQLRAALQQDSGQRVVVVDIRSNGAFRAGRIPRSVRLPVAGLEGRRVPPFGRVVVVWDGIDEPVAQRALAALNQKPGISAELLDGGYPAWTAAGGEESGSSEIANVQPPSVTLKQLMMLADGPNLVVVDLRFSKRQRRNQPAGEQAAMTDLANLLPNARIVAPKRGERRGMKRAQQSAQGLDRHGVRKRGVPKWLGNKAMNADATYVLVDAGDGRISERVARRMAARGLKRVYMLVGGERALASGGKSELVTGVSKTEPAK